jgi:hypothetical protein
LDAVLFAAVLLFGLLGSGLAFGVSELTEAVHTGSRAGFLGSKTLAKSGEEVGATRSKKAPAKVSGALRLLILHRISHAIAEHIEDRKLTGLRAPQLISIVGLELLKILDEFRRHSLCGSYHIRIPN